MKTETHLRASRMPQVLSPSPVHLPPQVIPSVHHLVRERVLQVAPIPDLVRAEQDPVRGAEPSGLPDHRAVLRHLSRTPTTHHVLGVQLAVEPLNLVAQEAHARRVGEEPIAVLLAARAVAGLVGSVPLLAVVLYALARHFPRQDAEVVEPPARRRVVACAGWVVGEETGEGGGLLVCCSCCCRSCGCGCAW